MLEQTGRKAVAKNMTLNSAVTKDIFHRDAVIYQKVYGTNQGNGKCVPL